MKKALKNLLCLILLVASVFSFSSCFLSTVDLSSYQTAVFDENGNLVYNDASYLLKWDGTYDTTNYIYNSPFSFKNQKLILKRILPSGTQIPLYGCGIEDFNEYVFFFNYSSFFYDENYYLKEGFEFPDFWSLTIQSISFNGIKKSNDSPIVYEDYDKHYEEAFSGQALMLKDMANFDVILPKETYINYPSIAERLCYFEVHFNEYQTLYLNSGTVFRYSNNLYFKPHDTAYLIKDEYIPFFENVLNNVK